MLTLLSRLFYYESAAGAKLDSARASGTNTLGKLAFVKASFCQSQPDDAQRCWETVVYIANDDPHRKATACPALAAVHTPES